MDKTKECPIEWGAAFFTLPGQKQSGDLHLVKHFPGGILAAAVDGLGHGHEAAEAAATALETLCSHPQEPVISLARRCHESLRATRGVVMSMASYNAADSTLTWIGVGNVAGILLHRDVASPNREFLLLRGGVIGDTLPPLSATIVPVTPGDILIFASDGIRSGFDQVANVRASPQEIANRILEQYARRTDDALVLVIRFIDDHEKANQG